MRAPAGIELPSGTWDCGSEGGSWSGSDCGCRSGESCGCGGSCVCSASCAGHGSGNGPVPPLPNYDGDVWAPERSSVRKTPFRGLVRTERRSPAPGARSARWPTLAAEPSTSPPDLRDHQGSIWASSQRRVSADVTPFDTKASEVIFDGQALWRLSKLDDLTADTTTGAWDGATDPVMVDDAGGFGGNGGEPVERSDVIYGGEPLCAAMAFAECCVELWCRPIKKPLMGGKVHCGILVFTCSGDVVTFELEDGTTGGVVLAEQVSDRTRERGVGVVAYIMQDSIPTDAAGNPPKADGWAFIEGWCYECDGCLDPCLFPIVSGIPGYPHLKTDYGGRTGTHPNSNTFARWAAQQTGNDPEEPTGATGWNTPTRR